MRGTKQKEVVDFLISNGVKGIGEMQVAGKFIDFAIEMTWGWIFLEIDEYAHNHPFYKKTDVKRMKYIEKNFVPRICWVRFNPDEAIINGQPVHNKTRRRKQKLLEIIKQYEQQLPIHNYVYLFYNATDDRPDALKDVDKIKRFQLIY